MQYAYPTYSTDLTPELLATCRDLGQRLLEEVGIEIEHDEFLAAVAKHDGVQIDGRRARLNRKLTDRFLDAYIEERRPGLQTPEPPTEEPSWSLSCGGFSMMVLDLDTDEVRPATCQDLSELIRLVRSFGFGGNYPCAPQDVPPLMRALACFKICWTESDNIRPFDYMDARQTPYLFDMHQVMGEPFVVVINIARAMSVCANDLDVFFRYYPIWKQNRKAVSFYSLCDYPMLGVSKPITSSGALASYLSQSFGAYMLFKLFDPELDVQPRLSPGMPVDLQQMCWAWGSPRSHLYDFLSARAVPALCGLSPGRYAPGGASMHSSSCAADARAAMEKMGMAMVSAMQGARQFSGAGNLAVDDLFSGVQFAIDVEIFEYVRETIESFSPHPDIISTDGLYELLRDVGLGRDQFYSHPDTASKVRNLLPVSKRRPHEKLRAWMMHGQNMTDRLKDECRERIETQEPFLLEDGKRKELERIYARAEKEMAE